MTPKNKKSYSTSIIIGLLSLIGIFIGGILNTTITDKEDHSVFRNQITEYMISNAEFHSKINENLFIMNTSIEKNNECLKNINCDKLEKLLNGVKPDNTVMVVPDTLTYDFFTYTAIEELYYIE